MEVKNLTYTNRIKTFLNILVFTFIGYTIHKLWRIEFDYTLLEYETSDLLPIFIAPFMSAIYTNKIKLKVVGITDINSLIEWMTKPL